MRTSLLLVLFLLLPALPSAWAALPVKDRTQQAQDKLLETYQKTITYEAQVKITTARHGGRLLTITDYHLALDRPHQRLLVDHFNNYLCVDGQTVQYRHDSIPDKYLQSSPPPPLDNQAISALPAAGAGPLSPDMLLLLSPDPLSHLTEGRVATITQTSAPNAPLQTLQITYDEGANWLLHIDPQTHLLKQAIMTIPEPAAPGSTPAPAAPAQPAAPPQVVITYDFAIAKHNQPLDPAIFSFTPPAQAQSVPTYQALVTQAAGGQQFVGKAPPPLLFLNLDKSPFTADPTAKIIVLDFWAVWCAPCHESLRLWSEIAAWAKKENKSLAVYAVNVSESAEEIKDFLQKNKLALPVLMDPDAKTAEAFGMTSLPHTVILHQGKVIDVIVGVATTPEEQEAFIKATQQKISDLLPPPPPPATPPAPAP